MAQILSAKSMNAMNAMNSTFSIPGIPGTLITVPDASLFFCRKETIK